MLRRFRCVQIFLKRVNRRQRCLATLNGVLGRPVLDSLTPYIRSSVSGKAKLAADNSSCHFYLTGEFSCEDSTSFRLGTALQAVTTID